MKKRLHYLPLFPPLQKRGFSWACFCMFLLLSLCLPVLSRAQTKEWDKTLGGSGDDNLPFLRPTSDGGYILGGWSSSNVSSNKSENSRGGFDYWVVKLNANGSIAWDKTFGGYGDDLLTALQPTNDGGYILGGFSDSNREHEKSSNSKGGADYWVIKLDASGNQVWDKTLGGSNGDYGQFVLQTFDGGYLVGGYSNSEISGNKSQYSRGSFDYWIVKLNAHGNKVWDKTYGGNADDKLTIMQQTNDDGYLIGGYSNSDRLGDKSENSRGETDYWVVKLSANGTQTWDKTFGGYSEENLQFLQQTSEGGYLLGGHSYSSNSGDRTQVTKGGSDYWVIKLNAAGGKTWDKAYGGNGEDFLSAFQELADGNIILGGSASYGISGDKTEAGKGDLDYWVVKIKPDGAKIWDKTIGGDSYDLLNAIYPTKNGYIMGGWSTSGITSDKTEESRGGFDYWVVKLKEGSTPNVYCVPATNHPCSTYEIYLDDFRLHTLVNAASGCNGQANSYINYEPTGQLTTTLQSGQSYPISLSAPSYPQGYAIWIDFNNDGDFHDKGEFLFHSTAVTGKVTGNISIPANVSPGLRRLRVRTKYNGTFTSSESCSLADYGETEDYTVTITAAGGISQWNYRYGGSDNEGLLSVQKTTDGGYILGGYSSSPISGDITQSSRGKHDYWLVKVDAEGQKQWDKRFGGSDHDYLNRAVQTLDGGYLLVGSSFSGVGGDKSQPSRGGRDYWVLKLDAQGRKQWDKRYGGSGMDELKKVLLLPTGDYLLAGYSNSPIGGDKSQSSLGGTDYWLVKIDANGTKLWDKRYGGTLNETLTGIVQTRDGGFLLGGSSVSGQSGDKSQVSRGQSDYWLVQVNKQGNLLWERTYGGSGADEAFALSRLGNEYYLAGQSSSPKSGEKTQSSRGGKDYWLIKVNSTGKKVWDRTFGGKQDEEFRAGVPTNNGGYLLAGRSYSGLSGEKTQVSRGASDYWIVQVSKDGQYQGDQTFGGSKGEELRAVTQARDGGFVLAGRSYSEASGDKTQPSHGGSDYWLVKVAPETSPIVAARESTLEAAALEKAASFLQASPNPFQERVKIRFSLPETQGVAVKVYDGQGREITTLFQGEVKANQSYQVEWQAGNKAAGMYLLQLQTPTQHYQQKLLLAK